MTSALTQRACCRLWLAVMVGCLTASILAGQEPEPLPAKETRVFEGAARAFQDGLYERAEKEFAAFTQQFPTSARLGEAILLQARAALEQRKLQQAIALLSANINNASRFTEPYRFWLAKAYFQNTNYLESAEAYAALAREFPKSARLLEAGYGEALARHRLKKWPEVVSLLQDPKGTFQTAKEFRPDDELVVRGQLLLGEALLNQGELPAAAAAMEVLAKATLIPEFRWRQQHLHARVLLAGKQWPRALVLTTNMLQSATVAGQRGMVAETISMQAGLLEKLGRREEAAATFQRNMTPETPADRRREALLKVIQLTLELDQYAEATRQLDRFFDQYPEDRLSDAGLLSYGELHLKQVLSTVATNPVASPEIPPALTPEVTNLLGLAMSRFQQLTTNHTNSLLIGQARLNQGWCLWLEGKIPESLERFTQAVPLLPFSTHKANAIYKLADTQFYLRDYTNALKHYEQVVNEFVEVSDVRDQLFDRARYQIIRANLTLKDLKAAVDVMDQLLKEQAESPLADRAMLLVAQHLSRGDQAALARTVLESCLARYPDSPLRPQVRLAMARSHVHERNWRLALDQYDRWIDEFATNTLRPQVEFNRAWVTAQSGQPTNALHRFTNYMARFPNHDWVPRAQYWLGDFYFNEGDFVRAQVRYQNAIASGSTLASTARMMAGRSAYAGQRWADAIDHFKALINDDTCPPAVKVEAYFGLGDTYIRQGTSTERPIQKFEEAIVVFTKIPQLYPEDSRVPNAWGRIGDCYYSMSAVDPKNYTSATNAFYQVLNSPLADVGTRSQAEIRLAMIQERLAETATGPERERFLKTALDHYLNIVYGTSPTLAEDEQPDPFWLKEAGLAAARLAEDKKDWTVAINLYQRLMPVFPPLRETLEKRISRARENLPEEP